MEGSGRLSSGYVYRLTYRLCVSWLVFESRRVRPLRTQYLRRKHSPRLVAFVFKPLAKARDTMLYEVSSCCIGREFSLRFPSQILARPTKSLFRSYFGGEMVLTLSSRGKYLDGVLKRWVLDS